MQTDCITAAYGLAWDQDECYGGSDAGLQNPPSLVTCGSATITFSTSNCLLQPRPVFLNIVIDMNHDGDWNDAQLCGPGVCAYEWAVKNATIVLPPGCGTITSPAFLVGPTPGPSWLRISMTDSPVTNDYPWVGGAGLSGFTGGETEDYPAFIENAVATEPSTWGRLKSMYR